MKLADIPPGSETAYRCAAKLIAEQVEFELEICRRLLGTEPEKVLELLATTPDWTVFLDDDDEQYVKGGVKLDQMSVWEMGLGSECGVWSGGLRSGLWTAFRLERKTPHSARDVVVI